MFQKHHPCYDMTTRHNMNSLSRSILIVLLSFPLLSHAGNRPDLSYQLASAFQKAHESQDYSKIEKLIYFKGVEQKTIDGTARLIKRDFANKIKKCFVTDLPKDKRTEYRLYNRLYRANLKPVGILRVEFESNDPSATQQHIASTYLVGEKDGTYLITLAVPVE